MKDLKSIAKDFLDGHRKNALVHYQADVGEWVKVKPPKLASDLQCRQCRAEEYFTPFVDPSKGQERVWICGKLNCVTNELKNIPGGTTTPPPYAIGVPWVLFCEIHGIGNLHHGIRFEDIQQSKVMISYMLEFVQQPKGLIYMQGAPGSGKTFAALGMCQLFLLRDTSCYFSTQTQLSEKWLDLKNNGTLATFLEKIRTVKLLIVDDFGTGDIAPGFMKFFLDLINTRLQWDNRGTVITTNLSDDKLAEICGDALIDRIRNEQLFEFYKKPSRRSKIT